MKQFEISPFTTPPRTDLDVSLESDNNEEDQEVLDDLDHEEEEEEDKDDDVELGKEVDGAVPAQEDVIAFCHPCKGNVCYCEDERQAIFANSEAEHQDSFMAEQVTVFTDDEEYYDALDVASNIHHGTLD